MDVTGKYPELGVPLRGDQYLPSITVQAWLYPLSVKAGIPGINSLVGLFLASSYLGESLKDLNEA